MPARPWADEPRLRFLRDNLSRYEAAQERRRTRTFLADLHDRYFARFPQENEKLLSLERKRVSTWMNNHSGGRGQQNGALLRATRVTFRELLRGKLEERRRQKLQATQAYSEIYWKSKLKAIIHTEWQQKREVEPELTKNNYLPFMNMRVRQLYDAEPDDVKAEVDHYRISQLNEPETSSTLLPGKDDLDEDEKERVIKARDVQAAIDNIESIMIELAKDIEEIVGLKSHFMLCGPEPKRNGNMVMFTITSGRTISGKRSFKEYPGYKADVHEKFYAFAKGCYTKEDRAKYTNVPFPSKTAVRLSSEQLRKSPTPSRPALRSTNERSRVREDESAAVEHSSTDSDSADSGEDREDSESICSPSPNVNATDDYDEMDIFSPLLPANRRIIESKDSGSGFTLYKTADGKWVSKAELQRLANMARNARLLMELGVDEAKRQLTSKSTGQDDGDDNNLEPEDEREFSITHPRSVLGTREQHPRQSKQNISYVQGRDDGIDLGTTSESMPAVIGDEIDSLPVVDVSTGAGSVTLSTRAPADSARIPTPTDSPLAPSSDLLHSKVISTLPVDVDSLDAALMEVDNYASLGDTATPLGPSLVASLPVTALLVANVDPDGAAPMEVDNHASLDDAPTPLGLLAVASSPEPIQSLCLDDVDFSKVPSWLLSPLKHLQKQFRGELEDKLLGAFVALEMAWQPLNKRIGTVGRPEAVAWWMKNARPIDRIPPCIDLSLFPSQVRTWWTTIQPHWRSPIVEDWPLPLQIPAGESWKEARLGGCNGIFLVVLCLYWWRQTAETEYDRVALAEYCSVAEDVLFVLEAILNSDATISTPAPLTSSAAVNAPANAIRKPTIQETAARPRASRSLRSSAKENIKPSRSRRTRS